VFTTAEITAKIQQAIERLTKKKITGRISLDMEVRNGGISRVFVTQKEEVISSKAKQ